MYSADELEALSYRELQKIAKNRKIRQSGKGITKKVLVSVLLDSLTESCDECSDSLPLQELEVKSLHPVSSPEDVSFEQRSFLDVERELNDSNKENANRRRLTYEISEPKIEPLPAKAQKKKTPSPARGKAVGQKNKKKVRIHESPGKKNLSTPRPPVKIVKTPVPNRKSSGRPGMLGEAKTPIATQRTPYMNKTTVLRIASSMKKTALASQPKTPSTAQKTPRLNKTVVLRMASSAKKSALEKNRSKIPKLDVKKAPNFSNIHQNAFDKMDSLWDVEHQRVLRRRNAQSSAAVFTFKSKVEPPKKRNSNSKAKMAAPSETRSGVFKFGNQNDATAKSSVPIRKFHAKDAACQAVNKVKPSRGNAMKEEQKSFLKGVRLNRRFQMQMQNRGLL